MATTNSRAAVEILMVNVSGAVGLRGLKSDVDSLVSISNFADVKRTRLRSFLSNFLDLSLLPSLLVLVLSLPQDLIREDELQQARTDR